MTSLLSLYRIITFLMNPIIIVFIMILRLGSNNGLAERIMHYKGRFLTKKPKRKKILMIHSASVGEFNLIKKLITKIKSPDLFIVLTTTTSSAVEAFNQEYPDSNEDIIQVYLPIDTPQLMKKFLDFWEVDYLLLVESEIWPNLISSLLERGGKIAIINGRLSDKSMNLWKLGGKTLPKLLEKMAFIGASSNKDYENFKYFYPNTTLTGNLKISSDPLPVNSFDLEAMIASLEGKEPLLAVSTHPGEEEIILSAYKKYQGKALLILAPRHKERAQEIAHKAEKLGLKYRLRFIGEEKNNNLSGIDLYLVNSLGELGTFFSLSQKVFLGGSLVPKIGGHNPCEPALFSCKIITGPHYYNFQNLMDDMKKTDALLEVSNSDQLVEAWEAPLGVFGKEAYDFVSSKKDALDKTLLLLQQFLD